MKKLVKKWSVVVLVPLLMLSSVSAIQFAEDLVFDYQVEARSDELYSLAAVDSLIVGGIAAERLCG